MHTQLGKDGLWAASGRGPMRWIVGEGATEMEAKARFRGVEYARNVRFRVQSCRLDILENLFD